MLDGKSEKFMKFTLYHNETERQRIKITTNGYL